MIDTMKDYPELEPLLKALEVCRGRPGPAGLAGRRQQQQLGGHLHGRSSLTPK